MRKGRAKQLIWRKQYCRGVLLASVILLCSLSANAAEKWSGVDEAVVEKFAQEQGRPAKDSYINTNQGDLLLFVFLLAGTVGGFTAGYYWRVIVERKDQGGGRR